MTLRPLFAATAFLTRVPIRAAFDAKDVGRGVAYFPLIGAALGAGAVLMQYALARVLPSPLVALALIGAGIWITGAIHLDGLADTADGLGTHDREKALRIMRDPTVGTFGVLALVLLVGIKVAAITTLMDRHAAAPYLFAAPVLGRWATALLGRFLPYARAAGGLGAAVTDHVRTRDVVIATVLAALLAAAGAGRLALPCAAAVGVVTLLVGRSSRRRLGGVTGDVMGANTELSEAAVLLLGVVLTGGGR